MPFFFFFLIKTPQEKWKESILKYRKQCQQILKTSTSIRYVGVINQYGRTLTGMIKPGVKPLWASEQIKNELFIISSLMTLRKSHTKPVGELDYIVLKHPKVTIIAFQRKNLTYYLSVDGKAKSNEKIISSIKKIIYAGVNP